MKLNNLLKAIQIIDRNFDGDIEFKALQYHSKKVHPGDVFLCIKGYQVDGHDYLVMAKEFGAVCALVEHYVDVDIPQIKVKDTRLALALLADAFYKHPSEKMKLIGITGTNGKTSSSFMTNSILEAYQLTTGLIGTVVVKIDDEQEASLLTTPESLDLHGYFSKMHEKNVTHATMEVSSSALELKRTAGADFDIVTLNNISREHIDNHGSFEKYYNFKAGLIRNAKEEAVAILNLDDPKSISLKDETRAKVITYGVQNHSGNLSIENLDLSTGKAKFTVKLKDMDYIEETFDIELSIPGFHCVYNSLVAISIGLILNIPIDIIQKGIKEFNGIERRFECIFEDKFKIYDDHFANAGNIQVTLETMDFMTYNNFHLVYAIRGSRGVTVNKENADMIVTWSKKLGLKKIIATQSKSHVIWKDEVEKEEIDIFMATMKAAEIQVELYEELPEAIEKSLQAVEEDDVILLAGCQGMDYGCHIALKQLQKLYPELDEKKLFAPLKYRVAGLLEE